jgi:hypothetical protein
MLKRRAQDQATEFDELGRRYNDLKTGCDELRIEKQRLTDELRSLQTQSFKSLDDAHWMAMDAEVSRRRLENIREAIDATAKTYAAPVGSLPSATDLSAEQVQQIRVSLQHVMKFKGKPESTVDEMKKIPHAPRLCLAALLSRDIHEHILDNPFFFVPDDKQQDGPTSAAVEGTGPQMCLATTNRLLHIWQEGQKCKFAGKEMPKTLLIKHRRCRNIQCMEVGYLAGTESETPNFRSSRVPNFRVAASDPEVLLRLRSRMHAEDPFDITEEDGAKHALNIRARDCEGVPGRRSAVTRSLGGTASALQWLPSATG